MDITKLTPIQQTIRELSDRIVKAQQPIRVLDAIKWNAQTKAEFFKNNFKKLPDVDQSYYQNNPLGYDPESKLDEFYTIEHDVKRKLGKYGPASDMMQHRCREYRDVIHMLNARGTDKFTEIAQDLYGSSDDAFYPGAPTVKDLSKLVSDVLFNIGSQTLDKKDEKIYTAEEGVEILKERLLPYFGKDCKLQIKVSDNIISDASAGADTIKLRKDVMFSERLLRLYEVHEGWVHLGTTFNGLLQPVCTFLSKGLPSSTVTQEGLGMLTEIYSFSSYPERVQRLTDRIIGISMAEEGADFIEVFNFFRARGESEDASYQNAVRVFRGSAPALGPFTKDLGYSKGFVLVYNYIRLCIQRGNLKYVPMIFVGKTSLQDIHLLMELLDEGIVTQPKYVPNVFSDLAAVCAWSSYSIFLNRVNVDEIAKSYRDIL